MLWIFAAIIISYLIGSIPTAYIFGWLLKGIDIRKVGSGNVGATNALRALGRGPGITVLILDIAKGFIVALLLGNYFSEKITLMQAQNLRIIMGLCCICGHNWTVFLNFKGGKGVATTFGVLIGLALKIAGLNYIVGLLILIWLVVFMLSRMVSLASILAGVSLPVMTVLFKQPLLLIMLSILLFVFVLIRHRSNVARILQGTESRLSFKKNS